MEGTNVKESHRLLAINPGSTSTKIAVYTGEQELFEETIRHDQPTLRKYASVIEQYAFRKEMIMSLLEKSSVNLSKLSAVVGRGGLLDPIEGGTYSVNDKMLADLKSARNGEHASNLGAILASEIADQFNIPAFIVDPVVVDELDDIARVSGFADIERKSIFHALNQKAVARKVAAERGQAYESSRLIVAHLGGGVTVGTHKNGRVVDVNNGLHGEGPFSPERAGTIPAGDLVSMCFSGDYYAEEIMKKIVGNGGLAGLLGTNDALEVERRIETGNERAKIVYEAMGYQIAKEIAAQAAVLSGKIDAIIITGGLAYGKGFVQAISSRVQWITDVVIKPGENEMQALAEGALRVLEGSEEAKVYTGQP